MLATAKIASLRSRKTPFALQFGHGTSVGVNTSCLNIDASVVDSNFKLATGHAFLGACFLHNRSAGRAVSSIYTNVVLTLQLEASC